LSIFEARRKSCRKFPISKTLLQVRRPYRARGRRCDENHAGCCANSSERVCAQIFAALPLSWQAVGCRSCPISKPKRCEDRQAALHGHGYDAGGRATCHQAIDMSLNGLDDANIKEAHEFAVSEAGGWYGQFLCGSDLQCAPVLLCVRLPRTAYCTWALLPCLVPCSPNMRFSAGIASTDFPDSEICNFHGSEHRLTIDVHCIGTGFS
jgi:hypothetical protein